MGISIDEKRVYDASEGPTPVYVVGEFGVARVNTSDDLVGEFGLSHRCTARDAAGWDGRLAVATDEDVLVGAASTEDEDTEFQSLGVGPAVAVGGSGAELLVAREDGAILRGDGSDDDWTELGELRDVRAVDGDLVAAESGVYKATDADLRHVGLDAVRDVSTAGAPLAATSSGLYKLGNGWMDELDGDFRAVSAAPASAGADAGEGVDAGADEATSANARPLGRAHAAREDDLFAHEGGEWREVELPAEGEVVALDHGEDGAYAVTEDGTFLLSVGDGWNHQILGLRGVRAVAAP